MQTTGTAGGYDSYASGNLQRDPEIGLFCVLGELSHQAGVPECSVQIVLRIEELVKGNAPAKGPEGASLSEECSL